MIDTALYSLLVSDANVSAAVGTRVYPLILPQNPTFPAMTYQLVGARRELSHGAAPSVHESRFQVDCYAKTIFAAKELADDVTTLLHGYRGTVEGKLIALAAVENELDLSEPELSEYRVTIEVSILHN